MLLHGYHGFYLTILLYFENQGSISHFHMCFVYLSFALKFSPYSPLHSIGYLLLGRIFIYPRVSLMSICLFISFMSSALDKPIVCHLTPESSLLHSFFFFLFLIILVCRLNQTSWLDDLNILLLKRIN